LGSEGKRPISILTFGVSKNPEGLSQSSLTFGVSKNPEGLSQKLNIEATVSFLKRKPSRSQRPQRFKRR
jgi:hypothetical protein